MPHEADVSRLEQRRAPKGKFRVISHPANDYSSPVIQGGDFDTRAFAIQHAQSLMQPGVIDVFVFDDNRNCVFNGARRASRVDHSRPIAVTKLAGLSRDGDFVKRRPPKKRK